MTPFLRGFCPWLAWALRQTSRRSGDDHVGSRWRQDVRYRHLPLSNACTWPVLWARPVPAVTTRSPNEGVNQELPASFATKKCTHANGFAAWRPGLHRGIMWPGDVGWQAACGVPDRGGGDFFSSSCCNGPRRPVGRRLSGCGARSTRPCTRPCTRPSHHLCPSMDTACAGVDRPRGGSKRHGACSAVCWPRIDGSERPKPAWAPELFPPLSGARSVVPLIVGCPSSQCSRPRRKSVAAEGRCTSRPITPAHQTGLLEKKEPCPGTNGHDDGESRAHCIGCIAHD